MLKLVNDLPIVTGTGEITVNSVFSNKIITEYIAIIVDQQIRVISENHKRQETLGEISVNTN